MEIEVLIATMNQNDYSLLDKMNIQSDAIIGNQCQLNKIEKFKYQGNNIRWYSFSEKGVGLNRNNILMRAKGDYLIFADDDMVFIDGYTQIVKDAFINNPKADVIVFNLLEKKLDNRSQITKKHYTKKIGYGSARIVCRRKVINDRGIFFNLCFGGGAEHYRGEDTLFLAECVKKGLNILCIPAYIAELTDERPSTWFQGYNDKYFIDTGVLMATAGLRFIKLRLLKNAFILSKNERGGGRTFSEIYRLFCQGLEEYRSKGR